jgi:hypothetical protein
MTKEMSVIPSEVEESRGESLKVISRDPSTSLRMTIHHSDFVIRHWCFVISLRLAFQYFALKFFYA